MKKFFIITSILILLFTYSSQAQCNYIQQVVTNTSGAINVMDSQQSVIVFHNANTLAATMTINLPANPVDGEIVIFCSKNGITLLSLQTTVGTIIGNITGVPAATSNAWVFFGKLNMWVKIR